MPEQLHEFWDRLEIICQKLWEEDRAAAVPLQALTEEFRGEVSRLESLYQQQHKAYYELREKLSVEFDTANRSKIEDLQKQLADSQSRAADLEQSLDAARRKIQELSGRLASVEQESMEFKDQFLKSEVERDAARAKKMEEYYQSLQAKAAALEKMWEERRAQLDADHGRRQDELRRKYEGLFEELKSRASELERSTAKKEEDLAAMYQSRVKELEAQQDKLQKFSESLRQREQAFAAVKEQLESDYRKKRLDLDKLKETFQAEIAVLIQRYQRERAAAAQDHAPRAGNSNDPAHPH